MRDEAQALACPGLSTYSAAGHAAAAVYPRSVGTMRAKIVRIVLVAAAAFFGTPRDGVAQVVALGASATAGYGLPSSESFPAQLQAMLQARGSATRVINAGVSGETTAQILARVSSSVPAGTKTVILTIFMLND